MLKIQGLCKSFFQGERSIEVLKDLDLQLNKGETLAILGQSGSGKSTLLSLLAGIDRSDKGKMVFEGIDLATLSEQDLTRLRSQKIGIIFQQFHLLSHLSAWENTSLALEILGQEDREKTRSILKDVSLEHRMDHFPSQLSGGEKQRVAIARSMVIEPDLLLADEPSGSLDEKTGNQVMELIFDLVEKENKALILVTHNKALASRCERVLVLEGGKLHAVENGL